MSKCKVLLMSAFSLRSTIAALLFTTGAAAALAQGSSSAWVTIEAPAPAQCSDGSAYSFHVRRADPERLLLFFNGGGACWNAATCDPEASPSYRVHAGPGSGNDPREYNGAFALDSPENPFRDWSQVFVSYCSGDVHLGDRASDYQRDDGSSFTVEHRGRRNADAVLEHISEHFAPQRILVAGGSAGAIASPVYATVVAELYPDAEVVQFAGGAAGYRIPPPAALWERWGTIEALPSALDAGDTNAETLQLLDFYRLAARARPQLSFYSWDNAYDAVQERFLALLGASGELLVGLNANLRELRSDVPTLRSYIAPGEFHTVLRYEELYSRSSDGVRAVEWIRDLAEGRDPGNVHCAPYCDDP
ncbi:MAG: pectin acetylesterase-family hydrolase [Pseudomonadota bacterium]